VHPDDLSRLDNIFTRAFCNGEIELVLEFRIVRHGEVRWIEARVLNSYDELRRPVRRIGAQIDVTERKQAEIALEASEAKFAGILEIAGDAILSIDANRRITLFNAAAERLFGYSRDEMLGHSIDILIPARFRAAHGHSRRPTRSLTRQATEEPRGVQGIACLVWVNARICCTSMQEDYAGGRAMHFSSLAYGKPFMPPPGKFDAATDTKITAEI